MVYFALFNLRTRMNLNYIAYTDCLEGLKTLPDNSIDSIVTDPPYNLTAGNRTVPPPDRPNSPYGRHRMGVNGDTKASRGFMGKEWDGTGIAFKKELWEECLRVLKPGGYLLAFGGTRTYHRMTCAIEDAGFEIRDMINWMYGSGFPKSLNISKAIDKLNKADRKIIGTRKHPTLKDTTKLEEQANAAHGNNLWAREWNITTATTEDAKKWEGWGTALKPAQEPICIARKPLEEKTVAENTLKYGTGGMNIDACRIESNRKDTRHGGGKESKHIIQLNPDIKGYELPSGRWPANVIHDGSDEIVDLFPMTSSGAMKHEVPAYEGESNTNFLRGKSGPSNQHGDSGSASRFFQKCEFTEEEKKPYVYRGKTYEVEGFIKNNSPQAPSNYNDNGSAARFFKETEFTEEDFKSFYCSKASKKERGDFNTHPTVKPLKLMEYLVKLVTPPNGICLDIFAGSGTTLLACKNLGFNYIGFESDPESVEIAEKRLKITQKLFN